MSPAISVIMSVYNENIDQLRRSIESILDQTFQDFEFIIVLDNPNNLDAERLIFNFQKVDKRIVFLRNEKNFWLPFSLNKAIRISKWTYLARMDSDDFSTQNRLFQQFNYLENHSDIDLLFTGWIEIDERLNRLTRIPKKQWFIEIKKFFFIKSMILHPTLMCRKEVFKHVEYPLTERPEDFILFLELIKRWCKFDVIEEVLFEYSVQNYDIALKFKKINIFSKNFLPYLLQNYYYYTNIYFWFLVFRVAIEYILSRNFLIFKFFYMILFKRLKHFFI